MHILLHSLDYNVSSLIFFFFVDREHLSSSHLVALRGSWDRAAGRKTSQQPEVQHEQDGESGHFHPLLLCVSVTLSGKSLVDKSMINRNYNLKHPRAVSVSPDVISMFSVVQLNGRTRFCSAVVQMHFMLV